MIFPPSPSRRTAQNSSPPPPNCQHPHSGYAIGTRDMAGFTETVRLLMGERGISVRGLVVQVSYDQGGLSKIIAGRRRCPRLSRG